MTDSIIKEKNNEKICFIGTCFSPDILNDLIEKDNIKDIPAVILGWKIIKGLSECRNNIVVINEKKQDFFPRGPLIQKKVNSIYNSNIVFRTYSKINIPLIERISKSCKVSKLLKKEHPQMILVYSLHTPYLHPAVKYALKHRSCKVVCIVPDLPDYMFGKHKGFMRLLKEQDIKFLSKLENQVYNYVFLTEFMKEKINNKTIKYIVIEGICDELDDNIENSEKNNFILYTGAIEEKYGLKKFINAYIKSGVEADLIFCGKGSFAEELKTICKSNNRIKYLGQIKPNEVKKLQRKATLLVNPRNNTDEYTKYSFPSKTMEYLLSGTPVMMEKLDGIPDEYYDYIIQVDDSWQDSLISFFSKTNEEIQEIGNKGKEFMLREKNVSVQGKKLAKFLEEI